MLWILLGVIAGSGWLLLARAHSWAAAPLDDAVDTLGQAGAGLVDLTVRGLGFGHQTSLAHIAAALALALTPGLVCVFVAEAVTVSKSAMNAAAVVLTCAAFTSFAVLPGGQALALCVAALVLDVLFAVGHGLLLRLPTAAFITAISGWLIYDAVTGADRLDSAVKVFAHVGGDLQLWRVALAAAGVAVATSAFAVLLRRR